MSSRIHTCRLLTLVLIMGLNVLPNNTNAQLMGEYEDGNGHIARFGRTSFGSQRILMNGSSIDTRLSSFTFPAPISILRLNPNGYGVTIGTSEVDNSGSALSVHGNSSDVHFAEDAIIGSQEWTVIQLDDDQSQLDDDQSGDIEKMEVLDGEDQVLLRVEENNNLIVGDILVEGRVIRDPKTEFKYIRPSDFEVISDGGGNYEEFNRYTTVTDYDYDGVRNDGSGDSYIGASINVPHGAILKKATINFYDTDQDGFMTIYLANTAYSLLILGFDDLNPDILYDDGIGFTSLALQTRTVELGNKTVDLTSSKYYIKVYSDDWDGQGIESITIEYTY